MSLNQPLKLNICECGHLHLTYKSITLHFAKEEFLHFATHVHQLATNVSSPGELRRPPSFPETKESRYN